MKNYTISKNFWSAFLFLSLLFSSMVLGASKKPNMLIYLSDDHSILDCSVYGGKDIPTPNMEQLANDGLTLENAFVASPTCAPSRAALLTGLMPAKNGAEANHTHPKKDIKKFAEYMREIGYETVAFGKVAHGKGQNLAAMKFDYTKSGASVSALKTNIKKFLQNRTSKKPLCLFAGTSNPHVPWPTKSDFDPQKVTIPGHFIDTPETREHRAWYYQEIKELDILLGDLRKMANKYLGKDHLFIYTSDHGAQWPFGKWNLYDAGIRTPFITSWPGKIVPGITSDAMVSWIDILPTIVELGGGTAPANIDGNSFAQVLLGNKNYHRDLIFTTHSGDGTQNIYPIRSVRDKKYKYIWNLHPEFAHTNHSDNLKKVGAGAYWTSWYKKAETDLKAAAIVEKYFKRPEVELYEITKDPAEQVNLAGRPKYAKIEKQMRAVLEKWMEDQGDMKTVFNEPRLLSNPKSHGPGLSSNK